MPQSTLMKAMVMMMMTMIQQYGLMLAIPLSTLLSFLSSHLVSRPAHIVGTACSPYHREPPVKDFDEEDAFDKDFDYEDAFYNDDEDGFNFDDAYLAGDTVGPLAERALEDVHIVLYHSPAGAVGRLKPVVLSISILKFFLLQDFSFYYMLFSDKS